MCSLGRCANGLCRYWQMWKCRVESVSYLVHGLTWWRHQMETFSGLLAFCAGNSSVTGEFPTQKPVTRSFDVFFDLRLNNRFRKQSWGWWFEMTLCPLWRHCNDLIKIGEHNKLLPMQLRQWTHGDVTPWNYWLTKDQVCASFVISLNQLPCNIRVAGDLKRNGAHVMSL